MVQVTIKDSAGKSTGQLEIPAPEALTEHDLSVVARAIERQRANARGPWAHTKTRAEVSGGGRKPWRQKGTGRARVGSTRSPIWRHGGIAWGPRNDRNWTTGLNKRERKRAMRVAIQAHALAGSLTILDGLAISAPKTKDAVKVLSGLGLTGQKVLVVMANLQDDNDPNIAVFKSFRNIAGTTVITVSRLNAMALAHHRHVVLTTEAWDNIQSTWFQG